MKKYNCNHTLDYAHEASRLCKTYRGCLDCPLYGLGCEWDDTTPEHIRRVQAWSDAHPETVLTDKQREVLNALNLRGLKYIAKDSDGEVYAYAERPEKGDEMWTGNCEYFNFKYSRKDGYATVSPLVEWSDTEPLCIAEALEQAEKTKQ